VRVPATGGRALLLVSWDDVMAALRTPSARDTGKIGAWHALTAVSLQDRAGLLVRSDPSARRVIAPEWRFTSAQDMRPAIAAAAWKCARDFAARGGGDLVSGYITPITRAMIGLVTGMDGDAADLLITLSDGTTGLHLESGAAQRAGRANWARLYRHADHWVSAAPASCPLGASRIRLAGAGMGWREIVRTLATVLNGLPTFRPVAARVLATALADPGQLARCADSPDLATIMVTSSLITSAHFTFVVPGRVTCPWVTPSGMTVRAGQVIIPGIHAAHGDPARPPAAHLAWGAGFHACLGRWIAQLTLTEMVAELGAVRARPVSGQLTWLPGQIPAPLALPAAA
jgi:cytochrome P450